jgi:hypothetical protein
MKFDTFLPIAAEQFCLLSYWLKAGIWAFPSSGPIAFKSISKQLLAKSDQFLIILNEAVFITPPWYLSYIVMSVISVISLMIKMILLSVMQSWRFGSVWILI